MCVGEWKYAKRRQIEKSSTQFGDNKPTFPTSLPYSDCDI